MEVIESVDKPKGQPGALMAGKRGRGDLRAAPSANGLTPVSAAANRAINYFASRDIVEVAKCCVIPIRKLLRRSSAYHTFDALNTVLQRQTRHLLSLPNTKLQAGMMNGRHLPAGQGIHTDMGRRRPYNNVPNQQYPPVAPMYGGYIPYNYYQPQFQPPYQPGVPPHQYAPYPPYGRSPPPPMQHYAPIPQTAYPRPHLSPALANPYQPPPPQPPPPPHTPSSTHSAHAVPSPMTPPPPPPQPAPVLTPSSPQVETKLIPFKAPLPWLSRPDLQWPTRHTRRRRRRAPQLSTEAVELPKQGGDEELEEALAAEPAPRPETPSTTQQNSEETSSTNPTTPSSIKQTPTLATDEAKPIAAKPSHKSTLPAIPLIPIVPKSLSRDIPAVNTSKTPDVAPVQSAVSPQTYETDQEASQATAEQPATEEAKVMPAPKSAPKLWTGLFNSSGAVSTQPENDAQDSAALAGLGKASTESLAEALRLFNASSIPRLAFLEPRGLVNTGNMCYMNSVSKRAAHRFKSQTPLIDAMIMFMREYKVIDLASSVEQLRLRLKQDELEQYGEPFTPEFVYDVIRRLPRFSSMRRGHQQDAEEFLGFLLEGLHDECVQVMSGGTSSNATPTIATPVNGPSSPTSDHASLAGSGGDDANGWLEVGPKQKAAVTRSSGTIITSSPVTKIFGGNLRSELRVPGLKDSVTLEPYQPLQLDIGASNVNNIIDALKGLTRPEALHGDFKSPKGPNVTATKQVFIETVPPVLILHLKRFQYDNAGGTQKIWKKVGYPLELEMPKEVFPRQKRGVYAHGGLPKYRLIAVVYHHGKNASGGHYTVDVRRQDGREWIRLDDTVIRRVKSEDVAEGGSEEDPKVLAAALEAHKKDTTSSGNMFSTIGDEDEVIGEDGWKQVNGSSSANGSGKKWSSVVNGNSTPKGKAEKFSMRDNKVAYLLFYQKI
ncbi:hypothetical protein B7463_g12167, partial [Scytalidium lignicola]